MNSKLYKKTEALQDAYKAVDNAIYIQQDLHEIRFSWQIFKDRLDDFLNLSTEIIKEYIVERGESDE